MTTNSATELGSGSRQADGNVQYDFRSVHALRGRESSAKGKWHDQGWELVSENRGTLRTELSFRRVKPKTLGAHLLSFVAIFRRLQPRTQWVSLAAGAVILAAGVGGIEVGDQFRMTAELSGSDYWGTGASGDFSVALKAKDGANDLPVFVDESEASGWQDGTRVEMVVKTVEATIDGETTDGWLEAQSAKTIAGGTTEWAETG